MAVAKTSKAKPLPVKKTDSAPIKHAYVNVLLRQGATYRQIESMLGVSHETIRKVASGAINPNKAIADALEAQEVHDLANLGFLAREATRLYLIDVIEGRAKPNPIAQTAIQDRSFQQRMTLQGKASVIYDHQGNKTSTAHAEARIKELQAELSQVNKSIDLHQQKDGTYSPKKPK